VHSCSPSAEAGALLRHTPRQLRADALHAPELADDALILSHAAGQTPAPTVVERLQRGGLSATASISHRNRLNRPKAL